MKVLRIALLVGIIYHVNVHYHLFMLNVISTNYWCMESEKLNMIEQVSAIVAWHKDDIKSTNIGVLSLSIRSRWRYLFEFDMEVELSFCSTSFITLIAMLGVRGTPGPGSPYAALSGELQLPSRWNGVIGFCVFPSHNLGKTFNHTNDKH